MTNQASEDELVFIVNEYRDINRNEFTQVTAKCKCGRGGWVRLDKHPAIQSIIRTEKLKLLDKIVGIASNKQFKDYTKQDIASFFSRLGELERELEAEL